MPQHTISVRDALELPKDPKPFQPHWNLYPENMPLLLIRFFERLIYEMTYQTERDLYYSRFQFHYGDTGSGCSYGTHKSGYIRLGGDDFILLHNKNSTQGPRIMLEHIIRLEEPAGLHGERQIWRHPRFHVPDQIPAAERVEAPPSFRVAMRQPRRVTI